jgi:hypothetical protein
MTLDLATIPADLLELTPDRDHASEPANESARELETEPTPAEPANPIPHSTASPLPQEIAQEIAVLPRQAAISYYPNDHFIHALYGGFMGMPDVPGALLRADLWDTFLDAYASPDLRHHFAHIVFPVA